MTIDINTVVADLQQALTDAQNVAATAPPPPTSTLPAWVPAPGTVATLTTTNTFASVNDNLSGYASQFHGIVDAYSGGVYNPYWGTNGCMVYHGGGHAATYDNCVVILDLDDLTFKRLGPTSQPTTAWTDVNPDPLFNTTYCEYADGLPGAAHTYDTLAIISPADGGGPNGSLLRVISGAVHVKMSRDTGWSHAFDFATQTWSRYSTNALSGVSPGGGSAYDGKRKRYWHRASLSSGGVSTKYLDIATKTHSQISWQTGMGDLTGDPDSLVMRFDATHDVLIATYSTATPSFGIKYFDPNNIAKGWQTPVLSAPVSSYAYGGQYPFDYVPECDKYALMSPADKTNVYEITLPIDLAQTWQVVARPAAITQAYVSGKRWSYAPIVKSFVWLAAAAGPVYAYRPLGT